MQALCSFEMARHSKACPGPSPPAENVGIVLLEAAHTRQPLQGPAVLIAVQDAKIRKAQRELSVAACAIGKHEAVPCSGACKQLALSRLRAQLLSMRQGPTGSGKGVAECCTKHFMEGADWWWQLQQSNVPLS